MTDERNFQLRFQCDYQGEENEITGLAVQYLVDGEWQDFNLGFQTQGFLIFVYAILNCQHQFLRSTANARQLQMNGTTGSIELVTNAAWEMQSLRTRYRIQLHAGEPTAEDADHILTEMLVCPVSTNLTNVVSSDTKIEFELADDTLAQHDNAA